MAKMSNFSRSTIMLLILIGWLQLAWMVSVTSAEAKTPTARQYTQEQFDKFSDEKKESLKKACPNKCYELYDKEKVKKWNEEWTKKYLEAAAKQDNATLESLNEEVLKQGYTCESYAEKESRPDDEKEECIKGREVICGACIKHMHIRNPLAICLIILLILLIIGGIAVGVMFAMKVGPFKKRQANVYNPNAQQANPQMSNQANQSQFGNADPNYAPGPGEPSHSPTQNFAQ